MSSKPPSELKVEAVKAAVETYRSLTLMAKELSVDPNTLCNQISEHGLGGALRLIEGECLHAQLKLLRQKIARLKAESDNLTKKAEDLARKPRKGTTGPGRPNSE